MPPIAAAVGAFALGLLAGFASAAAPAVAAGAALGAAGALRRRAAWVACAACLAAGALTAAGREAHDRRCRARVLAAPEWRVVVESAAGPGAYVRASLAGGGCDARVALAVEHGRADAGDVVRVRGTAAAGNRGVVVRRAVVFQTASRRPLPALRARVSATIGALFGANAPIVRALLVAETRGLDPALRDRFAAAGLVHMLSISGLHVAIIAAAAELLLTALRAPRAAASGGAIALTVAYVALIGAPAPAVRAGAMLAVGSVCRLRGRPTSPWAALAVGALVPLLLDSRLALDLGYQLSVAGIAALIAAGAVTRRVAPRSNGWRAALASSMLASTAATVVSAPLVAWHFGRVSMAAPVTNLAAAPLVAVIQPALFLAVLLAPVPPLARLVADATHPLLLVLDGIAALGASLPFASLTVAPTMPAAVLAGVACGAIVAACVSYFPARPLAVAVTALVVVAWLPLAPRRERGVELHMIDVGQGDAIALRTPRGRWLLFDAGRGWQGGDDGRRVVVPYLRRRGGDVAAFVMSHPHADHVGGAATVLRSLRPVALWDGAYVGTGAPYRAALAAAQEARVPWRRVPLADSLVVDGVVVRFLAPDSAWVATLVDANEASVVALVRYGAVRFLLVGDAERGEEEWLLANANADGALRADVLKVGHHGSATSTSPRFLDAVRPRLALVSVGEGNRYGHPSGGVLRLLAARGAAVLRTDLWGTVVVRTDGRRIEVETMGGRWDLPP